MTERTSWARQLLVYGMGAAFVTHTLHDVDVKNPHAPEENFHPTLQIAQYTIISSTAAPSPNLIRAIP